MFLVQAAHVVAQSSSNDAREETRWIRLSAPNGVFGRPEEAEALHGRRGNEAVAPPPRRTPPPLQSSNGLRPASYDAPPGRTGMSKNFPKTSALKNLHWAPPSSNEKNELARSQKIDDTLG